VCECVSVCMCVYVCVCVWEYVLWLNTNDHKCMISCKSVCLVSVFTCVRVYAREIHS
jgi:hypothetical protein